ncbi:Tab2/Atab2 family RNA-binding protein [Prochlorococcus sp. MIT 1223]|uniref:Tab2/Atab2 family RNA-binding protein n=1 Tax=Prochlorococcus sp. MIT 1223 TaxID=3096217 RepID=UPI002A749F5B|nr:Tab2/Atab2 family RNA-binding protein [Prochlorococcus sp. MIT 1223]
MTASKFLTENTLKEADWELDFYSRPVMESDGKKRWELLISSTENFSGEKPFQWEKICPAAEVNSIWLANAMQDAINQAQEEGWARPSKLRFWRPSMRTMIQKASEKLNIDPVSSRRTYSLSDWLAKRSIEIYPKQPGYIAGPLAPPFSPISNQPIPLPEAVRGDAWSLSTLPVGVLREADQWPIEFSSLLPIKESIDNEIEIPGIRLFSKSRALALAAWLGGLEPVFLIQEQSQLILEAGQDERWLVTDMDLITREFANKNFSKTKEQANGLQFISVQATPNEKNFTAFLMMRDLTFN